MTATAAPPPNFDLVRGDLLFRLQRAVGLIPEHGLGLLRRAFFWSLLGWLPIAVWAFLTQRALPGLADEPLLAHFGIHARLLVAVPLLILAEGPAMAQVQRVLGAFIGSGVVPPEQRSAFDGAIDRTVRLKDASLPWICLLALVLAYVSLSELAHRAHEVEWNSARPDDIGFGGYWYLYVGRAIFLTLVLTWIWRIVLLSALLYRIARLRLALVPTHPDRAGGLGFLETLPTMFAPLALALGVVLASHWAHDALYHGLNLTTVGVAMAVFVAGCVVMAALPLLAFFMPLLRAKKQALLAYGALVAQHGRLVQRKWIDGERIGEPALLDAPELGPVADTAALYEAVKKMRALPIGTGSVLPVAVGAALPVLAALALQIPLRQIFTALLKAVL